MNEPILDVAILGGGPAGMAAALIAGRARLHTVVLNAEEPRNAVTTASHGLLPSMTPWACGDFGATLPRQGPSRPVQEDLDE